ncbi:MAG: ATP-binding protein [Acidimicrobiia bacterium]
MGELEQLEAAAAALEAQRATLGDAVVDAGLRPLRNRMAALEAPTGEERKLVTTLFADLVGFTSMSERLDPEDVRAVLDRYFARWSQAIEGRGGVVEKFIGDAVMAVFGLRHAREDDPERAILAALDMVASLADLNVDMASTGGPRLEMRVGINTGEVVIGAVGERSQEEWVAIGDPINVAARLQAAAPVDGILIAHSTFRHVRGVFDVRQVPPLDLKGKTDATRAYVVERAKPRAFRAPTRGVEGVETGMVGRETELKRLQDDFLAARDGEPGLVTIVGDAGMGKSRLLGEFAAWLDLLPEEVFYIRGRAGQGTARDAFSLIRDTIAFRFEILDTDPPAVVREKLSAGFGDTGPDLLDLGLGGRRSALAGHLLGFDLGADAVPTDLEAQATHELGTAALVEWIEEIAAGDTVVMVLDDIHWADDSSLDLATRLVTEPEACRILVVCGARPALYTRRPAWQAGERRHQRIDLLPLSGRESRQLVGDILQKVSDVPDDLRETVVAAAEGNPFHVEELVKMLIEDGVIVKGAETWEVARDRLPTVRVPPTLVGVLQARIDALTPGQKSVLHRAAVIGRTFWDRAVAALGDGGPGGKEEDVDEPLAVLRARELIYGRESSSIADAAEHIFKHAVLRDVAYQSVLRRYRREYHAKAAEWLRSVAEATDRTEEFAALIAEHHDAAEEAGAAAGWYLRAGTAAAARFANVEALSLLDRALTLAPDNPMLRYEATAARRSIHNTLGDRPAESTELDELTSLADELDDDRLRADVELMRASFTSDVGRSADAEAHGRRAAELARSVGDTEKEAKALLAVGTAEWRLGQPAGAIPVLTEALVIARSGHHDLVAAACLHSRGVAHHNMGHYDDADADYRASIRLWNQAGDRRGLSRVLNSIGVLTYDREDYDAARLYLDRALATKRAIGERLGENRVLNNLAVVAVAQHDHDTVVESFHRTLAMAEEIDDLEGVAASHQGLGHAALHTGRFEAAGRHLEASRRVFAEQGDQQGEVQVIFLQAQLSNALGDPAPAATLAQQAVDTASAAGLTTETAAALAFIGKLHVEAERFDEAAAVFRRSLDLHAELGSTGRVVAVKAGYAEALQALGETSEARLLVDEVVEHFSHHGAAGVDEPVAALLSCRRVLAAQDDPSAAELTAMARRHLDETAGRISDPEVRRAYLENVPANRAVAEAG